MTLVGVLLAMPAAAHAQRERELGLQLIATTNEPVAVVGGPWAAVRVERRLRLAGMAGLGLQEDDIAWRLEGVAHFQLHPGSHGLGVYGGGGVALAGGRATEGYMVILLGVEQSPGGSRGWNLEMGVGGGFRVALGYRWH